MVSIDDSKNLPSLNLLRYSKYTGTRNNLKGICSDRLAYFRSIMLEKYQTKTVFKYL